MTLVTPRIVNNVSCVKRINDECYFSWQAQYMVKFKCHFSWQAQYSVKFGMIAGAQNVGIGNLLSPNFSHMLDGYFAWQVQYLVSLDNDTCCSAHCK